MRRVAGGPPALSELANRVLFTVEQDYLMKLRAHLPSKLLDLVEEVHPAQELGHHHVVPTGQMRPRGGQRYGSSEQPGLVRVLAPASDQVPHPVDVKVQGQRMLVYIHPRQS